MKSSCFVSAALAVSALAASALATRPAHADVHGVELQDGETVSYTFDYQADSGWADIYDCKITVRDVRGTVRFDQTFNLHDKRVYCGDAGRNSTRKYLYTQDSDSRRTRTEGVCWRLMPDGKKEPAFLKACGF